ncbi:hypothetical protein BDV06DRAFT_221881 [Aspergillus oleicola]
MAFLASVFVLLRFLARRQTSVHWDDWTCLVSLVIAYIIHSHRHPLNRRFLIKVFILLFYRRIFAIKPASYKATWIVSGLIFGFFVSTACGLIFSSNPVKARWKDWIPYTHIQYKSFWAWVSFSCIDLALEIVALAPPQLLVW